MQTKRIMHLLKPFLQFSIELQHVFMFAGKNPGLRVQLIWIVKIVTK